MVFQNYALYPHLTVYKNIAFPLRSRRRGQRLAEEEIRRRVEEAARILDIDHVLNRRPRVLSGGQRQRVALGRAMVREPVVFLLDEPLSNLDAQMRMELREQIVSLHRRLGTTFVYVTHDQAEAMQLASAWRSCRRAESCRRNAPADLQPPLLRVRGRFCRRAKDEFLRLVSAPGGREVDGGPIGRARGAAAGAALPGRRRGARRHARDRGRAARRICAPAPRRSRPTSRRRSAR